MMCDVEHLFTYSFAICIFFSWGVCSDLLPILKLGSPFSYRWVLWVVCVLWIPVLYSDMCCAGTSTRSVPVFSCSRTAFHRAGVFNEVQLTGSFSISWLGLWCCHHHAQDHLEFSPLLSSRSFIVFHFIFRPVIHFEWSFCGGLKVCVWIQIFACGHPVAAPPLLKDD